MIAACDADRHGMRYIHELVDIVPGVVVDRRCSSDRRTTWRGGRRDTDWVKRPLGGWARIERRERWGSTLLRWFSSRRASGVSR
jgi:hypothetical protein